MSTKDKSKEEETLEQDKNQEAENGKKKATGQTEKQETKDPLSELQAKYGELNDKYLRLYSEFDNFRKRTIKEKVDMGKRAGTEVFETVLPILDDFERALENIEAAKDVDAIKEGVELIFHKLKNNLQAKGLQPMESAKGQEFNEELHEAITNIPAPSEDLKGKVVDEVERGYYLNGIVLRYAKVVVGS